MNTEPAQHPDQNKGGDFSIFSYGFRPFFLGASIYTILALIPWALYLGGLFEVSHISLQSWHGHEMLFGFVAAGISGFLLTSIPKWTNTPPLTGAGLKRFFLFWVMGRIAFWLYLFIDHPLMGILLFLDLLLPIAQTLRVTRLFVATRNKRNFIFIGILLSLLLANLLVILELNQWTSGTAAIATIFAPNVIMLTIAIIGGRVIPNFTRSYLQGKGEPHSVRTYPALELLAIGVLVLNIILDFTHLHTTLSYALALSAAIIHTVRFSTWNTLKILDNPLLWVLHIGYCWLILSLFLKGAETWLNLPYHLYLHAFTVGAVGLFLLGIMSRAALGHTGRPMRVDRRMSSSYSLVVIAALTRLCAPFTADHSTFLMEVSTILWVLSFLLFLWVFVPILTRPRIDGRPG